MPLVRRAAPFSDPNWLFELKYDGFRALLFIDDGNARLISRNGNTFKSFQSLANEIAQRAKVRNAVLDGEIVCLDADGRPQFNDLLFRRREPAFIAFDCLWLNGEDQRYLPLTDRKLAVRKAARGMSRVVCCDYIEERGEELFTLVCEQDLEGIVAKRKSDPYLADVAQWVKVKNPRYSQVIGRDELFERNTDAVIEPWRGCDELGSVALG